MPFKPTQPTLHQYPNMFTNICDEHSTLHSCQNNINQLHTEPEKPIQIYEKSKQPSLAKHENQGQTFSAFSTPVDTPRLDESTVV